MTGSPVANRQPWEKILLPKLARGKKAPYEPRHAAPPTGGTLVRSYGLPQSLKRPVRSPTEFFERGSMQTAFGAIHGQHADNTIQLTAIQGPRFL